MRVTFFEGIRSRSAELRTRRLTREGVLSLAGLTGVVVLAAALRFANLQALGYANHYYAAAVKSMLQSWHNFFFVAAEPGGSVSVDKPPVGLWIQAIFAYFLGVNSLGLLLPEIVAGIVSVIVLYHLAQRRFGTVAGLVAALALAITPVVVATDRNNTIDSLLILVLLLAAWAFVRATEGCRLRHLLLGAALLGIGFNIKMLQAYLPLPAFYALYLLGSAERLWRKVAKLAVATLLLAAVSLSWALAVDLTPAGQRPYVGSSGNNSVLSLIVGYNGLERLLGMGATRGPVAGNADGRQMGRAPVDGLGGRPPSIGDGGAPPAWGASPGPAGRPPQVINGGRDGPGGFDMGQPGLLRLFTPPLSKEASWLLPFGLLAVALLALRTRLRWPLTTRQQAALLWGGWLATGAAFFSVAGFFHEYYLSMLGPPLATLVGVGVAELACLRHEHRWLAASLLLGAAGATLALQLATARAYVGMAWWLWPGIALLVLGAGATVATATLRLLQGAAPLATALVVAAMLVTPGIWSALTALNASENQSLPAAYSGRASWPANGGGLQVNQALLDYLQAHTQDTTFLMAVPSSMQGSDYVLATGRPVLYMGGFMGQDQVLTADKLAQLVSEGKLRYILWGGQAGDLRGQTDLSAWISAHSTLIEGFDTVTRNAGAPDGTSPQAQAGVGVGARGWGGDMRVALYELRP